MKIMDWQDKGVCKVKAGILIKVSGKKESLQEKGRFARMGSPMKGNRLMKIIMVKEGLLILMETIAKVLGGGTVEQGCMSVTLRKGN